MDPRSFAPAAVVLLRVCEQFRVSALAAVDVPREDALDELPVLGRHDVRAFAHDAGAHDVRAFVTIFTDFSDFLGRLQPRQRQTRPHFQLGISKLTSTSSRSTRTLGEGALGHLETRSNSEKV